MNALVPINAAQSFTVGDVQKVAEAIARGGLFGSKDPYAVLTLCLLAQAEGQHPAVVFRDYHIINGKPAKKAEAMLRDFLNSGGKIEWHRLDDDCADATFSHAAGGSARISWDGERVTQAQLGGNAMHKKYPRQMLRSRTISEGVRTIYPGATSGLYVPEEVASFGDEAVSPPAPRQDAIEHHPQAGEVEPQRDEPAPREKLEGKHSSKTALKAALQRYGTMISTASSTREIDAIVKDFAADLEQGIRYLPLWMEGDESKDSKGLTRLTDDRRELIGLVESLQSTETALQRDNWMGANEAAVEALDDGQRRQFDTYYETHDAGLMLVQTRNAG